MLPSNHPDMEDIIYNSPSFKSGEFNYVSNNYLKDALKCAWQAITLTENWDTLKQNIESFYFCKDSRITEITDKMKELGYTSDYSFGCILREMQIIAKKGEKDYIKHILLSEQYNEKC